MPRSSSRSRTTPRKRAVQASISSPASETRESKKDSTVTSASDVLIFYPNLIGYARVLFMIASLYYAASDWKKCFICYGCAFFGDLVDGFVARRFNQSTVYGGILDMVTDRVSTAGFLCMLSNLYTKYAFYSLMLIVLDIASH